MDIREVGTKADFWIRAKIRLIDILLGSLKIHNCKILNVGCGTGEDMSVLNKYGKVYITDTNKKTLDAIPRRLYVEKKLCSADDIDFPSGIFDIVVAFDVLEHIRNDRNAINEIRRVLSNRGYFVFTVPAFQSLYSAQDKAVSHYRRYSRSMLLELLSDFKIKKLSYWNFSLFLPMAILRIVRKGKDTLDTTMSLPYFTNELFYYILCGENLATKIGFPMPIGLSIYGICKNTKKVTIIKKS